MRLHKPCIQRPGLSAVLIFSDSSATIAPNPMLCAVTSNQAGTPDGGIWIGMGINSGTNFG